MQENTVFSVLNALNCNEHVEKKGNQSYLFWAWAWQMVKSHFPDASYTIYYERMMFCFEIPTIYQFSRYLKTEHTGAYYLAPFIGNAVGFPHLCPGRIAFVYCHLFSNIYATWLVHSHIGRTFSGKKDTL